jgi:hypothetical protein
MGEAALGAVAVVLAAWVEVPGISPGNSRGDRELAEPEPVAPAVPLFADPPIIDDGDPDHDAAPNCDAAAADDEEEDTDGDEDAAIPERSNPSALLLFVPTAPLLSV